MCECMSGWSLMTKIILIYVLWIVCSIPVLAVSVDDFNQLTMGRKRLTWFGELFFMPIMSVIYAKEIIVFIGLILYSYGVKIVERIRI